MNTRVITFSSQTATFKAQRMLQKQGIRSKIARPNPRHTPHGCSWGLEIDTLSVNAAIYLLVGADIPYGVVL